MMMKQKSQTRQTGGAKAMKDLMDQKRELLAEEPRTAIFFKPCSRIRAGFMTTTRF